MLAPAYLSRLELIVQLNPFFLFKAIELKPTRVIVSIRRMPFLTCVFIYPCNNLLSYSALQ